eukprot:TRINITY_DN31445_c0_g1_i2.p1 TRINITY_DN31445_c0_g1~~TRINITY_DN31445_c0_g1_i2.p1  ORF type:complete len:306 (-),score=15.02 TRINITY_DN31445_c0_g1_i2:32-949(-)
MGPSVYLPLLVAGAMITWSDVQASRKSAHAAPRGHTPMVNVQPQGKGKMGVVPPHAKGLMPYGAHGQLQGKGKGKSKYVERPRSLWDHILNFSAGTEVRPRQLDRVYAMQYPDAPLQNVYKMTMGGVVPGMPPSAHPPVMHQQGIVHPCMPPDPPGHKPVYHCTSRIFAVAYHSSVMVGREELAFNFAGVWLNCGPASHGGQTPTCRKLGSTTLTAMQVKAATDGLFRQGSYDMLRKNCNTYATVAIKWLVGYDVEPEYRAIEGLGHAVGLSGALFNKNPAADSFDLDRVMRWAQNEHMNRIRKK